MVKGEGLKIPSRRGSQVRILAHASFLVVNDLVRMGRVAGMWDIC